MSILAVALILAQQPVLTYRAPAQSVGRLLSTLASQAGPWEARGKIADEVVVVAVKGTSADEFRKKLAEATTGVWSKEGEKWVLTRDEQLAKLQEREELSRLAARFAKSIAEYAKPVVDVPTFTAQEAERRAKKLKEMNEQVREAIERPSMGFAFEQGATPQDRLMARLLLSFDPKDLAALPVDTRTVFSTRPTAMQRSLPNTTTRAIQAFADEYQTWQAAAERYRPQDPEQQYVDFGLFGPLKSRPSKLLFIVTKWSDNQAMSLEAKLIDDKGRVLTSASAGLDANSATPGKEDAPAKAGGDAKITLTKESLELASIRTGALRGGDLVGLSENLRAKMLKPEEFDPLAFSPSELLLGLAEAQGRNLIATVPDSAFDAFVGSPSVSASHAQQILEAGEMMKFAESEGWLLAVPGWPSSARNRRVPRTDLGQLVRELSRPGASSLTALSKFARTVGGTSTPLLAAAYVSMLEPVAGANLDTGSWDLLRLFSGLTPAQLAMAGQRGTVPVSSLDSVGRAALNRLVFFGINAMPLGMVDGLGPDEGQTEGQEMAFESINMEATELLPNGMPDKAALSIESYDGTVAIAPGGSAFAAEDLGTQLAMRERPEIFPFVGEAPLPARFALASRRMLNLSLFVDQRVLGVYSLSDFRKGDGRLYGLNDMPEAFRSQVERSRKESRDAFKNVPLPGTTGSGGSNIPPNR